MHDVIIGFWLVPLWLFQLKFLKFKKQLRNLITKIMTEKTRQSSNQTNL